MNYQHKEAYCLMEYQCQKCGAGEMLWNSRDGVTPYLINCLVCQGRACHVRFENDRRMVDMRKTVLAGDNQTMRIFVDVTREAADKYAHNRLQAGRESGVPIPPKDHPEYMAIHKAVSDDIYHEGKGVDVITGAEFFMYNTQAPGMVM